MPQQNQIPVHHRVITAAAQRIQPQKFTGRLAHLFAAFIDQETEMHPITDPRGPGDGFALRDFVGMMHAGQIFAAGMDIKMIPQQFHAHGTAFRMPTRKSHAPGAVPFHLTAHTRGRKFPQRKIRRITLCTVEFNARARTVAGQRPARQRPVRREFRRIVINPIPRNFIGISQLFQFLHQFDLFGDVIGRMRHIGRPHDVQIIIIAQKFILVKLGNIPDRFVVTGGTLFHFVFAAIIFVIGQMADVGNIHDMMHIVPVFQKHAL